MHRILERFTGPNAPGVPAGNSQSTPATRPAVEVGLRGLADKLADSSLTGAPRARSVFWWWASRSHADDHVPCVIDRCFQPQRNQQGRSIGQDHREHEPPPNATTAQILSDSRTNTPRQTARNPAKSALAPHGTRPAPRRHQSTRQPDGPDSTRTTPPRAPAANQTPHHFRAPDAQHATPDGK